MSTGCSQENLITIPNPPSDQAQGDVNVVIEPCAPPVVPPTCEPAVCPPEGNAALVRSAIGSPDSCILNPSARHSVWFGFWNDANAAREFIVEGSDLDGNGRGLLSYDDGTATLELCLTSRINPAVMLNCTFVFSGQQSPPPGGWAEFPVAPHLEFTDNSLNGECAGMGAPGDPRFWTFWTNGLDTEASVCRGIEGSATEGAVIAISHWSSSVPEQGVGADLKNFELV